MRGTVVSAADGSPIAGAEVHAYRSDKTWAKGTRADGSGRFTLRLPAGTYRILFAPPPDSRYLRQYWRGQATLDAATDLAVKSDASGIDVALVAGYFISGSVTSVASGAALEGVSVWAWLPGATTTSLGSRTDASGAYRLLVAPGTYRVQFDPPTESRHLRQYWQGKSTLAGATDIRVNADVSGVNAALLAGAVVSGTVTSASGAGIEGVTVWAWLASGVQTVTNARTSANGSFSMLVPLGTYRVQFQPPAGSRYLDQYWQGKTAFAGGRDLTVGGDVSGVNATLASGYFISGTVTSAANGKAIDRVNVWVWPAGGSSATVGARTDASGAYSLLVPPGTYRMQFDPPPESRYVRQYWQGRMTLSAATDIGVSADVSGINASLVSGYVITGTVTARSSTSAIADALVVAYNPGDQNAVATAVTSATGAYKLVLPSGAYRIRFIPPSGTPYGTGAIDLVVNSDLSGIDAALP